MKIDNFEDGCREDVQDFKKIKQGYRNTVGMIFEKIHKLVPDERLKAQLKFKIFCCHLINRVFDSGIKAEFFLNFTQWKK